MRNYQTVRGSQAEPLTDDTPDKVQSALADSVLRARSFSLAEPHYANERTSKDLDGVDNDSYPLTFSHPDNAHGLRANGRNGVNQQETQPRYLQRSSKLAEKLEALAAKRARLRAKTEQLRQQLAARRAGELALQEKNSSFELSPSLKRTVKKLNTRFDLAEKTTHDKLDIADARNSRFSSTLASEATPHLDWRESVTSDMLAEQQADASQAASALNWSEEPAVNTEQLIAAIKQTIQNNSNVADIQNADLSSKLTEHPLSLSRARPWEKN